MKFSLTMTAAFLIAGPAYAGGLFDDLSRDIGRSVEQATHDTGKAVEKAAQDAGKAVEKAGRSIDAQSFVHDLSTKAEDELVSLNLSIDPCSEVDCHGVPSDIARQAVGIVRTQKQNLVDLEVRKSQAWAAVVSAGISFLSLVISILSFVRAGQRTPSRQNSAVATQPQN